MSRKFLRADANLLSLYRLACNPHQLEVGAVRLVGWTDFEFPGIEIRPRASQTMLRTLMVANLKHGEPPAPVPDANMLQDVAWNSSGDEDVDDSQEDDGSEDD